jgi:hypothetical protein
MMEAPEKWTFDAPYTASFNGSGDDTWLGLKSHGMLVASFAVKQWGSEQACIEAAWRHAYEPPADLAQAQAPAPVRVEARKTFPLLGGGGVGIDWQLVQEHAGQARTNHGQTLEELARRGGLSWCELYAVLHDRRWQKMDSNDAMIACRSLEARYRAALEAPDAGVVAELVEALKALQHAVCGPTGFAEAVRHNTGLALPWPSLDAAEERLSRALAKLGVR